MQTISKAIIPNLSYIPRKRTIVTYQNDFICDQADFSTNQEQPRFSPGYTPRERIVTYQNEPLNKDDNAGHEYIELHSKEQLRHMKTPYEYILYER